MPTSPWSDPVDEALAEVEGLADSRIESMRLRRSALDLPTEDQFTADSIVPPVPVITIDQMLTFVGRESSLIDRRVVIDMLLDIRNAIWTPTDYSVAVAPLLDQHRGVRSPV